MQLVPQVESDASNRKWELWFANERNASERAYDIPYQTKGRGDFH